MARASGRVIVLAVLLGLFGMHGLASGRDGCHATALPMPAAHSALPVPGAQVSAAHVSAGAMPMGPTCVFVQPAGWPGHPAVPALAITTPAVLLAGSLSSGRARSGRAPPGSGVSLLRRVCVSRT